MPDRWYYAVGEERRGPVEAEALERLVRDGQVRRSTLVWTKDMPDWAPAGEVERLSALFAAEPAETAPPLPSKPFAGQRAAGQRAAGQTTGAGGFLHGLSRKLSDIADLPTISRMPVREILMGGLARSTRAEEMEETFAAGTITTTPPLSEVPSGWPAPRVFWRIFFGAVATYVLLRVGITTFKNPNFYPGLIVIGSFVVPLSVVILFFELNTPRNVSVYQVGKLLLLGGALSLIVTSFLARLLPGSAAGDVVPALLTGVVEETGKALALLIVVANVRYRWQLNGLLFGAAVGAGFAGFESAGYAFNLAHSLDETFGAILIRGILAPGGHVIWTAIVGSAIWKAKGDRPFEARMLLAPVVIRRWSIAVLLHGMWDTATGLPYVKWAILSILGWYVVLGILTQALDEVEAAKKASQKASRTLTVETLGPAIET